METTSRIGFITNCIDSPFRIRRLSLIPLRQILLTKRDVSISAWRSSSRPVAEVEEDDVLQIFLKDRALNGDFVSKATDLLWRKEVVKSIEDNASVKIFQEADQVMQSEYNAGFLKLSSTHEWISGESSPPLNKKPTAQRDWHCSVISIPAAIYGFWILSHRYFSNDFFDFQLTPAMVGLFAYKAAALVQVYRDNDDVQFIFPQGEE